MVSKTIKIIGLIIGVLGIVIGLLVIIPGISWAVNYGDYEEITYGLMIMMPSIISGIFIYGFGEIISLLVDISEKLTLSNSFNIRAEDIKEKDE